MEPRALDAAHLEQVREVRNHLVREVRARVAALLVAEVGGSGEVIAVDLLLHPVDAALQVAQQHLAHRVLPVPPLPAELLGERREVAGCGYLLQQEKLGH